MIVKNHIYFFDGFKVFYKVEDRCRLTQFVLIPAYNFSNKLFCSYLCTKLTLTVFPSP